MQRRFLAFSAFSAFIAVLFLAMAAHALSRFLPEPMVKSIETAGYIQLIHAIALIAFSGKTMDNGTRFISGLKLILTGSSLFSYSIYLIALKYIEGFSFIKFVWPITPLGGIILCIGWFFVGLSFLKPKN
jgi:uncharacterized membrane protein YgdD (TMEM256/DUF423 family)